MEGTLWQTHRTSRPVAPRGLGAWSVSLWLSPLPLPVRMVDHARGAQSLRLCLARHGRVDDLCPAQSAIRLELCLTLGRPLV